MLKSLNPYITDLKNNFQEILICSFLVLLLFRFFDNWWQNRDYYNKASKIHGPPTWPIIGSAYIFLRNSADYLNLIEKLYHQYPKICKIWFGPYKAYCILTDPEYIKTVFSNPKAMDKNETYDTVTDIFGPGLLTAPASIWKTHRRAISRSFNKNTLDSYVKIFAESSAKFIKQMKEVGSNKEYDWSVFAKMYSLDVSSKTMLGVDLNIHYAKPRGDNLGHAIEMVNHYSTIKILKVWYHVAIIYKFSSLKKILDKYRKMFNNITTSAVSGKLHEFKENVNAVCVETEERKRRPDLLELIYKHPIFTEQSLIYEVNTFIAASMDTTGMTVSTLFILLAMYPEIQQKVYDEVIDAIGLTGEIEPSNLVNLKYTERAIKESLRLFPPVVTYGRLLTADIDVGDVIIPKGMVVMVIPSTLHRDPKYWKDPLIFNPDRFLLEEKSKRHPCTYLPFSYGARNCIGEYYAFQNIKTLTATVIREFKMCTAYTSVEEVEFNLQAVLTLRHGVKLWFEPRT